MAFITVLQLKNAVAAIPAGANAWELDVPAGLTLPALTNRTQNADGGQNYTVRGLVHLDLLTWEPAE